MNVTAGLSLMYWIWRLAVLVPDIVCSVALHAVGGVSANAMTGRVNAQITKMEIDSNLRLDLA